VLGARLARLERAAASLSERRAAALREHAAARRAADPERALERGYALALDGAGAPLATARAVRAADTFDLRMADGTIPARVSGGASEGDR
jgi:exodeoxyribonuclease VII large subunit